MFLFGLPFQRHQKDLPLARSSHPASPRHPSDQSVSSTLCSCLVRGMRDRRGTSIPITCLSSRLPGSKEPGVPNPFANCQGPAMMQPQSFLRMDMAVRVPRNFEKRRSGLVKAELRGSQGRALPGPTGCVTVWGRSPFFP